MYNESGVSGLEVNGVKYCFVKNIPGDIIEIEGEKIMKSNFPDELYIAYAVCEQCNNKEFIISGQTQICNKCMK